MATSAEIRFGQRQPVLRSGILGIFVGQAGFKSPIIFSSAALSCRSRALINSESLKPLIANKAGMTNKDFIIYNSTRAERPRAWHFSLNQQEIQPEERQQHAVPGQNHGRSELSLPARRRSSFQKACRRETLRYTRSSLARASDRT